MDIVFKYLDKGDKGFISYNDFCELSEEKRRNLDRIDNTQVLIERKAKEANQKDWVQTYLQDSELIDLENISKRMIHEPKNKNQKMMKNSFQHNQGEKNVP